MKLYLSELEDNVIPVKKLEKDKVDIEVNCLYNFEAPVCENSIIGTVKVNLNEKTIDVIEIKNKNEIKKKGILDYLKLFSLSFVE